MNRHLYYDLDVKLSEGKSISLSYNFDYGVSDPLGIDDQYTIKEMEKIGKQILRFAKAMRKVELHEAKIKAQLKFK